MNDLRLLTAVSPSMVSCVAPTTAGPGASAARRAPYGGCIVVSRAVAARAARRQGVDADRVTMREASALRSRGKRSSARSIRRIRVTPRLRGWRSPPWWRRARDRRLRRGRGWSSTLGAGTPSRPAPRRRLLRCRHRRRAPPRRRPTSRTFSPACAPSSTARSLRAARVGRPARSISAVASSRGKASCGRCWGRSCGVGHETGADAWLGNLAMSALVTTGAARADSDGVSLNCWPRPRASGLWRTRRRARPRRPSRSPSASAMRWRARFSRRSPAATRSPPRVPMRWCCSRARSRRAYSVRESLCGSWSRSGRAGCRRSARSIGSAHRPRSIELLLRHTARVRRASRSWRCLTQSRSTSRCAAIRLDAASPRRDPRVPLIDAGALPEGRSTRASRGQQTGHRRRVRVPGLDDAQRANAAEALLLARVLQGPGGRLASDVAPAGLGCSRGALSARPRAQRARRGALAPGDNLDALVLRMRALFERLRTGGARGGRPRARRARVVGVRAWRRLDPRARAVDLFAGELAPPSTSIDLARLRTVAGKVLDEDHAQLVVARLK